MRSTEGDGLVEFIDPEDGVLEFCQDPYTAQNTRLVPIDNGPVIHLGRVKGRHYWKVHRKRKVGVVTELPANEIRFRLYEAAPSLKPIWISVRYIHFGLVVIPDNTDNPPELPWFWMDTWAPIKANPFTDERGPAVKITPRAPPRGDNYIPFFYNLDLAGCKARWDEQLDLRQSVKGLWPEWFVLSKTKGEPVQRTPAYGLPASFNGDVPRGKLAPKDLTPPWTFRREDQPLEKPGEKK